MKIFHGDKWDGKVNFVDDNNVLVGYDDGQDCCEHADWFFAREVTQALSSDDFPSKWDDISEKLKGYNFDKDYILYVSQFEDEDYTTFDEGGMVVFKLVNEENGGVAYLHLFNIHNGYYGNGFTMLEDGVVIHDECL